MCELPFDASALLTVHGGTTSGLLEGLNSLIQAAKRRARWYRSNRNFIAMTYLIVGKLNARPVTA